MFNFLHTFRPQPLLFSWGPLHIYWYGFFIVLGIAAALLVSFQIARRYQISREAIFDLCFWLIIWGLIGARIYDVLLFWPFYQNNLGQILKIWEGGLAIHGAIIAGLITIYFFVKKRRLKFWLLTSLITPGLALAQAIGRWGNYFNQELFGLPTEKPWGIPIETWRRPLNYSRQEYFQPSFLYESLGCLFIFIILVAAHYYFSQKKQFQERFSIWISLIYVILYSILRFFIEFTRLDETPDFWGWRWPQIISLILIIISIIILINTLHAPKEKNKF